MNIKGQAWKFGANVDTDVIIPVRYLTSFDPVELGKHCLEGIDAEFAKKVQPGDIIVAAENFGCGSSREHAPWALLDQGFRCIIAPSFADIFFNNCLQNGILPAVLTHGEVQSLFERVAATEGFTLTVDLEAQTVTTPHKAIYRFAIDPFRKECLYRGLDSIGLTLQHQDAIVAYERRRKAEAPWLFQDV
jgi:3-isopropylmalate/(R)-2-methylmalate dehydratase small subunit